MLPSLALDQIELELTNIVKSEVSDLYADLKATSPRDTGHFSRSWSMMPTGKMSWRITNSADYADILARGRRFVNGRYEGSLQWQHGLNPMLQKTNNNIERRSNAVRY